VELDLACIAEQDSRRGWLPRTPFRLLFDALVDRAAQHSARRVAVRVMPRL